MPEIPDAGYENSPKWEIPVQTMSRLSITALLWIVLPLSAYGLSAELVITPGSLDQGDYRFSVTTEAVQDGVTFHVTVIAKNGGAPPNTDVFIGIVDRGKSGFDWLGVKDVHIPITLKKEKHGWTASFTVPGKLLKEPNLIFSFSQDVTAIINGKEESMDDMVIYEIHPRDFVKK